MNKIKSGDEVICNDASGGIIGELTEGQKYIVEEINGPNISLVGLKYDTKTWRFSKAKQPEPEAPGSVDPKQIPEGLTEHEKAYARSLLNYCVEWQQRAETAEADLKNARKEGYDVGYAMAQQAQQAQPPQAGQARLYGWVVDAQRYDGFVFDEDEATRNAKQTGVSYGPVYRMDGAGRYPSATPASAALTLEEKVMAAVINRECKWPTCLPADEQDKIADEVMRSLAGETPPPASAAPVERYEFLRHEYRHKEWSAGAWQHATDEDMDDFAREFYDVRAVYSKPV